MMELHGPIGECLVTSTASAKRLRGRAVYRETLDYWKTVLAEGRRYRATNGPKSLDPIIERLASEIARRTG